MKAAPRLREAVQQAILALAQKPDLFTANQDAIAAAAKKFGSNR